MKHIHIIIAALLMFCGSISLSASETSDTLKKKRDFRLSIRHINGDSYTDTVYGSRSFMMGRYHYLPKSISWGRKKNQSDTTPQPKLKSSGIIFPNWKQLGSSISTEKLNSDTLSDMVFYFWGKKRQGQLDIPQFRIVAVFGQKGLDSIKTIDLETIDSVQLTPYYARVLTLDEDFTDPLVRHADGRLSYVFPRIKDINIPESSQERTKNEHPWSVELFPNPASTTISLMAKGLPAGIYRLEVLNSEGSLSFSREMTVSGHETTLDIELSALASGYYIARLTSERGSFGSYRFITVH